MDPRFTTLFFLRHQRGIAGTLQAFFMFYRVLRHYFRGRDGNSRS